MPDAADRRTSERVPVVHSMLWLEWDDPHAGRRHVRGTIADISCNGAKVIIHWPLEPGTVVRIGVPRLSFEGDAIVRRCRETEEGFTLGLEFSQQETPASQPQPETQITNSEDTSSHLPR